MPDWQSLIDEKYGKPVKTIPGTVYVLHYDVPQVVRAVGLDYAGSSPRSDENGFLSERPITHYVGWTQHADPRKRISKHGPAGLAKLMVSEGTLDDEEATKLAGICPVCGERLADSLSTGFRTGPR
jgi:hypothetical protein